MNSPIAVVCAQCQSHVIWHVLVFLAALSQVWALVYCHGVIPEHSCPAGFGDVPA
jgi:hypothetical protein